MEPSYHWKTKGEGKGGGGGVLLGFQFDLSISSLESFFDSSSLSKFQCQNRSHVLQTNVCFAGSICVSEYLPAGV